MQNKKIKQKESMEKMVADIMQSCPYDTLVAIYLFALVMGE